MMGTGRRVSYGTVLILTIFALLLISSKGSAAGVLPVGRELPQRQYELLSYTIQPGRDELLLHLGSRSGYQQWNQRIDPLAPSSWDAKL